MVSETFELVRVTGLRDSGEAPEEGVVLHRVLLDDVPAFLARKRGEGLIIDVKLLALLSFI